MSAAHAAPHATRMTADAIDRDRSILVREARDLAATATRLAEDVDQRIACGDVDQMAAAMHQIVLRTVRLTAMRQTAELFTAELNPEVAE